MVMGQLTSLIWLLQQDHLVRWELALWVTSMVMVASISSIW